MSEELKDWRCKLGRHHYVEVSDGNPELRGQTHRECTRCGQVTDVNEYEPGNPGLGGY